MSKRTINDDTSFIFSAEIKIIDINPYVSLPADILESLFLQAHKRKGPIPIKGNIEKTAFIQTLVKFRGEWRLYLNTPMRKAAKKDVGDRATFDISYDPLPREIIMHSKLEKALHKSKTAKSIFESLRPSLQKEIIRYINLLKTEESIDRNVQNAIQFLLGKKRFIGRDKP